MTIKIPEKERHCFGRWVICLVVGLVLSLVPTSTLWAHKVFIYAWVDGDTIYTESYFGAKRKVNGGLIQVFDLSGKTLLEGRTNDQGEFSFKCPQKTDIRIVVEAGMGHRGEFVLKKEEFSEAPVVEAENSKADEEKTEPMEPISADARQIKTLVEEALDSRLKPIKKELAAIRKEKSAGMTEIIGGIGYIFGIMGLIMYFRGRKKVDG